jgi:hypothetical protein
MKNKFLILILFFCFQNCTHKNNEIKIYLENSSNVAKTITVTTFINNRKVDERTVAKDTIADRFRTFNVKLLETDKNPVEIAFRLGGRTETTSCIINPDSIKNVTVHVNFVETLFKKGYQYESKVLDTDTIVRKDFYCEILK